jgi:DNA-binding beta-propeller fold protein YncE
VSGDENRVVARVKVGDQPQNVAITPDGKYVYVSNTGAARSRSSRRRAPRWSRRSRSGTEPYGMAITPDGRKLYVANARSNDVSVIDTDRNKVERDDRRRGPRAARRGDHQRRRRRSKDEKVYVTQFLGVDVPGVLIGRDDYKEGRVT